MTPEDRYQIGYAYYKANDLSNAIRYFEPISNGNTALTQNVLYHLADCYLRSDDGEESCDCIGGLPSGGIGLP